MTKNYETLITFPTFRERFEYLKTRAKIGQETFAEERYLNQTFYHSREWLLFKDRIIFRDRGLDLGVEGFEIYGPITIHHIVPITPEDLINHNLEAILNENNVICTSSKTHKAIHYGSIDSLISEPIVRYPGDTCPWK